MLLRVILLIGALGAGGVAAWLVVAARPEPVTKVVVEPGLRQWTCWSPPAIFCRRRL
jgi:hypothetical protein